MFQPQPIQENKIFPLQEPLQWITSKQVYTLDILSSPNDIIFDSSFDAVNMGTNITIGIEREGTGSVIGLPSFASDLGFIILTAGTPEFYNP